MTISFSTQLVCTSVPPPVHLPLSKEETVGRGTRIIRLGWWDCVKPILLYFFLCSVWQKLLPDPILRLRRIIGFGGATTKCVRSSSALHFQHYWHRRPSLTLFQRLVFMPLQALWTKSGDAVVYPCHAIVVSLKISSNQQKFFTGHTDKVNELGFHKFHGLSAWDGTEDSKSGTEMIHRWRCSPIYFNRCLFADLFSFILVPRLKASTKRRRAPLCLSMFPSPPAVGVGSGFRWQHNSSGISANWQPLCGSSLELRSRKLSRHVWNSRPLCDLSEVTMSSMQWLRFHLRFAPNTRNVFKVQDKVASRVCVIWPNLYLSVAENQPAVIRSSLIAASLNRRVCFHFALCH